MGSRRGRWVIGSTVALAAACVGPPALFCGPPWLVHDVDAAWLRRRVADADGAFDGQTTATRSAFGLLWGNSNHCDWEAWARIESDTAWQGARAGFEHDAAFVWDVTDPERPVYVALDGRRVPYGDRCAECFEAGLEAPAEATLFELARLPRRGSGRYTYVVWAVGQSYEPWDLRDPRCH